MHGGLNDRETPEIELLQQIRAISFPNHLRNRALPQLGLETRLILH